MRISSPAFQEGLLIPPKYTCDGENISPPIHIEGVPPEAQSLALWVHDPDASSGDWLHWLVWNIDPLTTDVSEGFDPAGATEGLNDFGRNDYGGPCPPQGETHKYVFTLFALNTMLTLDDRIKSEGFLLEIKDYIIDKTELTGLYERV